MKDMRAGTGKRPYGVLIVGVGGQGVIVASDIIAEAAMSSGFDVKKSEVHGMSQRGGTVVSHVRFGPRVWSSMIPEGQADALIAFEQLEALRAMHQLHANGVLITSCQRIVPPSVTTSKQAEYPQDVLQQVQAQYADAQVVDAPAEARALGSEKMASVIFVGALSRHLGFEEQAWRRAITHRVPKGTEAVNWQAFQRGKALAP